MTHLRLSSGILSCRRCELANSLNFYSETDLLLLEWAGKDPLMRSGKALYATLTSSSKLERGIAPLSPRYKKDLIEVSLFDVMCQDEGWSNLLAKKDVYSFFGLRKIEILKSR